jgi:SET domain-containing protein
VRELPYEYRPFDLPRDALTSPDMTKKEFDQYVKNPRYQIYTQVDTEMRDGDDVVYLKGQHFVNRTGVYAFVPKR